MDDIGTRLLRSTPIMSRDQVLASPSPVPKAGGVYAWWFRRLPADIDTTGCVTRDGLTLLYVGISPQAPPANGRPPSSQNLRIRIGTHYGGNAEGSTLRKTLGCLLADELGIELRRVGSGTRMTFLEGEQRLSAWMQENALVSWVACEAPWDVEEHLIGTLDLPLNLDGNHRHPYRSTLSGIRSAAVRRAKELPVVENPGIGGRHVDATPNLGGRFAARALGAPGLAPLGRLVLAGEAATAARPSIDDARAMLGAALGALRREDRRIGILVTPAGFFEPRLHGTWHDPVGWATTQQGFDRLAIVATDAARELMTPELRDLAAGTVDHLILGVDVWPTDGREPHAEVACHFDVASGTATAITGKTYPTTGQPGVLIREPDAASHIIEIREETVAVLVCFDLAAWNPRGNAVASGTRAATWQSMQDAVTAARPTLAVQLPHTVDNPRTWTTAWSRFAQRAGGRLRAGTTAIRHLDRDYRPVGGAIDPRLLSDTGTGARVVDVVVAGRAELASLHGAVASGRSPRSGVAAPAGRPAEAPTRRAAAPRPVATASSASDRGIGLAVVAADVFRPRAASHPDGIRVAEMLEELRRAGHAVAGDDPSVTLSSAMNSSQKHGVWVRQGGGPWALGSGESKMTSGLSGRPLAEALYDFVREAYPGHVFHYEDARVRMEQTGVDVKGTGSTTRAALARATDLFEHVPRRGGLWRWK